MKPVPVSQLFIDKLLDDQHIGTNDSFVNSIELSPSIKEVENSLGSNPLRRVDSLNTVN